MSTSLLNDHVKLRHIRCFLDVVDTGSARASAERLCITESAVSKTIKELEADVGAQLFNRTRHGMSPTEAGARFARYARNAVDALNLGFGELTRPKATATRLRVGCMPSMASGVLPEVLRVQADRAPGHVVQVVAGDYKELIDHLRKGSIEFIFGRMPLVNDLVGLHFEQLALDRLVFVARPSHPLAGRAGITADQMVEYPWTLPPEESVARAELLRSFALHGGRIAQTRLETHYMQLSQNYVLQTDAIWVVSLLATRDALKAGGLVRLGFDQPRLEAPIGIISKPGHTFSRVAENLATDLRSYCRLLTGA